MVDANDFCQFCLFFKHADLKLNFDVNVFK